MLSSISLHFGLLSQGLNGFPNLNSQLIPEIRCLQSSQLLDLQADSTQMRFYVVPEGLNSGPHLVWQAVLSCIPLPRTWNDTAPSRPVILDGSGNRLCGFEPSASKVEIVCVCNVSWALGENPWCPIDVLRLSGQGP